MTLMVRPSAQVTIPSIPRLNEGWSPSTGGITATKATTKRAAIYPGSQRWMNRPATTAAP